jgi:hypothetical protein
VAANVGVPVTKLDDKDCSTTPGLPVVNLSLRPLDTLLWRGGTPTEVAFCKLLLVGVAPELTFEA